MNESWRTYRGHVGDELPEGLFSGLCIQVPDSVVDCTRCNMDNTLFGAEPAGPANISTIFGGYFLAKSDIPSKLRIGKHVIPSLAHVSKEIFKLLADETLGNLLDGDANLGER